MASQPPQSAGPRDASLPYRFLRVWFCVSLVIGLAMLVGVGYFAKGYEEIFTQMEMRQLPLPTEGLLAWGRFVRTSVGLAMVIAFGVASILLAARGTFDRVLIKLVVFNCIGITLLIPFSYLGLHMPIVQIQRHLSD